MAADPGPALNRVAWPPLILVAGFAAALGAGLLMPLPLTSDVVR